MMGKILTSQIKKYIYYSLESCGLFPEEKRMLPEKIGINDRLYQHVLHEVKTSRKNVVMAWIDYKRAPKTSMSKMHKYPTKS